MAEQRKAEREKLREERRLARQENAEDTTASEIVRTIEGFSEHVFDFVEDILRVVQGQGTKKRQAGSEKEAS